MLSYTCNYLTSIVTFIEDNPFSSVPWRFTSSLPLFEVTSCTCICNILFIVVITDLMFFLSYRE